MKKKKMEFPAVGKLDEKWQREEDLRTLQRAEEVKRSPSRLRGVKLLAKENMKALHAISGKEPIEKFMKRRGVSE